MKKKKKDKFKFKILSFVLSSSFTTLDDYKNKNEFSGSSSQVLLQNIIVY